MLHGASMTASFREQTELAGLQETIREAQERGRSRDPVTHRIVVHPEFLWHPKMRLIQRGRMTARRAAEMRRSYACAIRRVLRGHPDAVVLTYPEAKEHHDGFRYGRSVPTAAPELVGGALVGSVDADGMRRLLELLPGISPDDRLVLDGARLGCCPTQAAVQLTALRLYGVFAPPSSVSLPADHPARVGTRRLRHAMDVHGLLTGKAAMGVIGDGAGIGMDGLTEQMADASTRIYG